MRRHEDYPKLLESICRGEYEASLKAIESNISLPSVQKEELLSLIRFHKGQLDTPRKVKTWEKFLYQLLIKSSFFEWLITPFLISLSFLIRTTGQRKLLDRLFELEFKQITHYRYNHFSLGLTQSFLLSKMLPPRKYATERTYLYGLYGHLLCLGGQFHRGLPILRKHIQKLSSSNTSDPFGSFLEVELAVALYLDLMISGHITEAVSIGDKLTATFSKRPYFWGETFFRSMRMNLSVELLDDTTLYADTARLKELLGANFIGKFALRASVFAALLAAIRRDMRSAYLQLTQVEELYGDSMVRVERARFHEVRALVALEFGNTAEALHHSARGLSLMTFQEGNLYHIIDAALLDLEIKLRSQFIEPDLSSRKELRQKAKSVFKKAKQIKGAPSIVLRCRLLNALMDYIEGNYTKSEQELSQLKKITVPISKRLAAILGDFDSSLTAGAKSIEGQNEANLKLEESLLSSISSVLIAEDLTESATQSLKQIFAAESCTATTQNPLKEKKQNNKLFFIDESKNEKLIIELYLDNKTIVFELTKPLAQLQFDKKLRTIAEMVLAFLHANYSRHAILEAKRGMAVASLAEQVAHDIRSPLAALNMVVELLQGSPEDLRLLIRSAVIRINDIANQLIEKSRAESVKDVEEISSGRKHLLAGMVEGIITEKRFQIKFNDGIKITSQFTSESMGVFVQVEADKFKRCLSNLLNNALDAIHAKGDVEVWISCNADKVFLTIKDNGKGIPADVLPRLGKKGISYNKSDGSGLGLYFASECFESWKGKLKIESTEGKGTTVHIELPRAKAPDWFVPTLTVPHAGEIIVIDDDKSIHEIWKKRLGNLQNLKLKHFTEPSHFFEWSKNKDFQSSPFLFLCDYEFMGSHWNGIELIKTLDIVSQSILVTSRSENKEILAECEKQGIKLIPKEIAPFIPIQASNTLLNTSSDSSPLYI